jgi:hypothetical protein
MRIVIPFDSSETRENPYAGGRSIDFHGCSQRALRTIAKSKTYKLRSLVILTPSFNIVGLEGRGAGQTEDFSYVPTSAVVGVELPMPEWTVEPGQVLLLSLLNASPSYSSFGGYFIGDM